MKYYDYGPEKPEPVAYFSGWGMIYAYEIYADMDKHYHVMAYKVGTDPKMRTAKIYNRITKKGYEGSYILYRGHRIHLNEFIKC